MKINKNHYSSFSEKELIIPITFFDKKKKKNITP